MKDQRSGAVRGASSGGFTGSRVVRGGARTTLGAGLIVPPAYALANRGKGMKKNTSRSGAEGPKQSVPKKKRGK